MFGLFRVRLSSQSATCKLVAVCFKPSQIVFGSSADPIASSREFFELDALTHGRLPS
jgi:hypothetical protein